MGRKIMGVVVVMAVSMFVCSILYAGQESLHQKREKRVRASNLQRPAAGALINLRNSPAVRSVNGKAQQLPAQARAISKNAIAGDPPAAQITASESIASEPNVGGIIATYVEAPATPSLNFDLLNTVTFIGGSTYAITYNDGQTVMEQTGGDGSCAEYTYDEGGNLLSLTIGSGVDNVSDFGSSGLYVSSNGSDWQSSGTIGISAASNSISTVSDSTENLKPTPAVTLIDGRIVSDTAAPVASEELPSSSMTQDRVVSSADGVILYSYSSQMSVTKNEVAVAKQ